MMSMVAMDRSQFRGHFCIGVTGYQKLPRIRIICASDKMKIDSTSSQSQRKEEPLVALPKLYVPPLKTSPANFQFDRLQPSDEECIEESGIQFGIEFGQFVAREAVLDEEYWTAAWLRAETKWDNQTNERYVDRYKRQFAEQEFHALKRRCKGQFGHKCYCIIMVRRAEKNVKRTVLKSVVGTLDISIRYLLDGETFPGERVKASPFSGISRADENRYGYVANLCVSKSARRRGIASNLLQFAIEFSKLSGLKEVFVHVHRSNQAAQELYQKMGFKMVQMATSQLSEEQTYLLCLGV